MTRCSVFEKFYRISLSLNSMSLAAPACRSTFFCSSSFSASAAPLWNADGTAPFGSEPATSSDLFRARSNTNFGGFLRQKQQLKLKREKHVLLENQPSCSRPRLWNALRLVSLLNPYMRMGTQGRK